MGLRRSVRTRVGRTSSEATVWMSTSSMMAKVARGRAGSLRVAMTAGMIAVSETNSMSYDGVGVSGLERGNLARGGALVVVGGGIGSMDTTGAVRGAWTASEATMWQSDSSITGMAGVDRRRMGSARVAVTSGGLGGSATNGVSFDRMELSSAGKANTAAHQAGVVRVSGIGYGAAERSIGMRLGVTDCESSVWSSSVAMTCMTSPSLTGSLRVMLTVGTTTSTASEALSYDAGNLGEMVLGLTASNTGLTAGSQLASVSGSMRSGGYTWAARVGSTGARGTMWTADTQLVCRVAMGATGGSLALIVTGSVAMGTSTEAMSYDGAAAHVTVRGNAPTTGSVSITIFSKQIVTVDLSFALRVAGTGSAATSWISVDSVRCSSAKGLGMSHGVHLTLASHVGSLSDGFSFDGILS